MVEFRLRLVTMDQPVLKTAYYEVNDYERRYPSELPADHDPLRLRRRVRDPLHEAEHLHRDLLQVPSTPASRSSLTPAAVWISSTRSTASSKIGSAFLRNQPACIARGLFRALRYGSSITKPRCRSSGVQLAKKPRRVSPMARRKKVPSFFPPRIQRSDPRRSVCLSPVFTGSYGRAAAARQSKNSVTSQNPAAEAAGFADLRLLCGSQTMRLSRT